MPFIFAYVIIKKTTSNNLFPLESIPKRVANNTMKTLPKIIEATATPFSDKLQRTSKGNAKNSSIIIPDSSWASIIRVIGLKAVDEK